MADPLKTTCHLMTARTSLRSSTDNQNPRFLKLIAASAIALERPFLCKEKELTTRLRLPRGNKEHVARKSWKCGCAFIIHFCLVISVMCFIEILILKYVPDEVQRIVSGNDSCSIFFVLSAIFILILCLMRSFNNNAPLVAHFGQV